MSKLLIINQNERQQSQAALLDGNVLLEYHLETVSNRSRVGDIYRGQVRKTAPNMQAVFIDIGLDELGLLAARDAGNAAKKTGVDLTSLFKEGQIIWVQVIKEASSSHQGVARKGLRLTTDLHLETAYMVYFPDNHHIHISKKITDQVLRQSLKDELSQEVAQHGIKGGFIIRSVVAEIAENSQQQWLPAVRRLWEQWQSIKLKMRETKKVGLVYQSPGIAVRLAQRCYQENIEKIFFSSIFQENFIDVPVESECIDVERVHALWNDCYIDEQLDVAMRSMVLLENGGSIVIEQTEALVSIDVNMGSAIHENFSALQVNLEAANMIVRQLRLRNLSGIIIADFINMDDKSERKVLLEALRNGCAKDDERIQVHSFTKLGLVEMTRERTSLSLCQMLDNV